MNYSLMFINNVRTFINIHISLISLCICRHILPNTKSFQEQLFGFDLTHNRIAIFCAHKNIASTPPSGRPVCVAQKKRAQAHYSIYSMHRGRVKWLLISPIIDGQFNSITITCGKLLALCTHTWVWSTMTSPGRRRLFFVMCNPQNRHMCAEACVCVYVERAERCEHLTQFVYNNGINAIMFYIRFNNPQKPRGLAHTHITNDTIHLRACVRLYWKCRTTTRTHTRALFRPVRQRGPEHKARSFDLPHRQRSNQKQFNFARVLCLCWCMLFQCKHTLRSRNIMCIVYMR